MENIKMQFLIVSVFAKMPMNSGSFKEVAQCCFPADKRKREIANRFHLHKLLPLTATPSSSQCNKYTLLSNEVFEVCKNASQENLSPKSLLYLSGFYWWYIGSYSTIQASQCILTHQSQWKIKMLHFCCGSGHQCTWLFLERKKNTKQRSALLMEISLNLSSVIYLF